MAKGGNRIAKPEAESFWDRPPLMNLVADLLFLFSFLVLAWAASETLQRLPFFPLRQLQVDTPLGHVSGQQIEYATRIGSNGNFFTVDLDETRQTFEKLPWVRKAEVRRRWPDGLTLSLEEHVAVARWQRADGESRLVNSFGETFAAASDDLLPSFAGPEGSAPAMLARFKELGELLGGGKLSPVSLTLSARQAWQVKLTDGTVLDLGRDEAGHPVAERVGRYVAYQAQLRDRLRAKPAVVDMRYPNGFAVRLARADNKS